VDSCTAILEHADGRLELVEWGAAPAASKERPRALPQPAPAPARVAEAKETVEA
jgi:hypothetical protein